MVSQMVALWLALGCGLLFLIPVRNARARTWLLTAINLIFLRLLLSSSKMISILALVVVIHFLLKAVSLKGWRKGAVIALGAATLGLFLLHKLPDSPGAPGQVQRFLAAVGFSYVTLRILYLLRAVFEQRHPAPDFAGTINYLLPFHMLLAGPIQSYDDYVSQPGVPPPITTAQALRATERIAGGVFKKFALAFVLRSLFLTGFRSHGWHFALEAQVFYIWLFLDFSGLSDIAIGIGGLLGIKTPENFDRPYLARNMINFWERWHISLSQFIRSNLYIPIQLQLTRRTFGRQPLWCASAAFTVAFALCGLWHGLSARYLLWGLLNAGGLIATNLYRHYLRRYLGAKGVKTYLANQPIRVLATVLTFEFVAFSLSLIREPV
jgi:D-alanyl-lipoteichoic acid acyltransferase DltB (MBOAT superfamily)